VVLVQSVLLQFTWIVGVSLYVLMINNGQYKTEQAKLMYHKIV